MTSFRIFEESGSYILGHEFETAIIKKKNSDKKTIIEDHFGDPTCGIIGPNEKWFAVGGEGVTYYDFQNGCKMFFRNNCPPYERSCETWHVHDMRMDEKENIRILLDPWSDYASIWVLNLIDFKLVKIQDGPSFKDKPYQEKIDF